MPDVSPKFITAIKKDAKIKKLFRDADFQKLLQNPTAINALVALIRGEEVSTVKVRVVDIVTVYGIQRSRIEPNIKATVEGLRLKTHLAAGSTRNLVFTVKHASGKPLRNVELNFIGDAYSVNDVATATFKPSNAENESKR